MAEGDATCILEGGWGYLVRVDRSNDTLFDRYAHLPEPCPWSSYQIEQGDFISYADCSGDCDGTHLHYQRENSSNQSQTFALSGLNNFCDHTQTFCTGDYGYDNFVSDNAGPSQGAGNVYIGAGMAFTYRNVGHILCAPSNAWSCLGSSHSFWSGSRKATHNYLAGDGAWQQQFANWSGAWSDIDAPDACGATAYWVQNANWFAWLNNTWLGHPRSSYSYSPGSNLWFQYFRHGVLFAPSFGATPYPPTPGEYTTCYP